MTWEAAVRIKARFSTSEGEAHERTDRIDVVGNARGLASEPLGRRVPWRDDRG